MTRFLRAEPVIPELEQIGFKVKDPGLLSAALGRSSATVFGQDAYPTLWDKAAALFDSVIKNHAMFDGNKRTAWIVVNAFLQLNGFRLRADTNGAFEFILGVAEKRLDLPAVAIWLDRHSTPLELS
jgi:death-on-curing protein